MNSIIKKQDVDRNKVSDIGNCFMTGNGYMGVRGTLDEYSKDELVAVNIAGVYDKVADKWRESINVPNPFYSIVEIDGVKLHLLDKDCKIKEHVHYLDFEKGILNRKTVFQLEKGCVTIQSSRFVSMDLYNIAGATFEVSCDFEGSVCINTKIDENIWESNGEHFDNISFCDYDEIVECTAKIQNSDKIFTVMKKVVSSDDNLEKSIHNNNIKISYQSEKNKNVVIKYVVGILNPFEQHQKNDVYEVIKLINYDNYDDLVNNSVAKWEKIWDISKITIDGDEEAEQALNYSIYQLNCIAPRHKDNLSIPARGLSGQTYKGAIFWDTEMFMLDYFLCTDINVAKSLVKYRIDTLEGALDKAKQYNLEGAFYAWESQENGIDACSDFNVVDVFTKRPNRTYFRDKQVHISSAVSMAIVKYYEYTNDISILVDGGAETVIECARFYLSLLSKKYNKEYYDICDVVGPDEYHERVNNNTYTNKMAKKCIEDAIRCFEIMEEYNREVLCKNIPDIYNLIVNLRNVSDKIFIHKPNEEGIIEQFDNYFSLEDVLPEEVRGRLKDDREYWGSSTGVAFSTQVIKQADVVLMLEMFNKEYDKDILKNNWHYYEPRTEHGSSLSACMYSLLSCRFGNPDYAYPFFMKSANIDILGGSKQWAGLVYIGGTHPAASGGAYKVFTQGFAGVEFNNGDIEINPCLPSHWNSISFSVVYNGKNFRINISKDNNSIEEI